MTLDTLLQQQRPRILVVDDEAFSIQVLDQTFSADHEVFFATNGEQALAMCLDAQPDLVLLDVEMPGMDGYEVCRRLKSNPLTRHILVIFTAQQDEVSESTGCAAGAVDFIVKPINITIVRARANTHLTLKRQADQMRKLAQAVEQSPVMIVVTDLAARIE